MMKKPVETKTTHIDTVTNTNSHNISIDNSTRTTIHVNFFGQENLDYIHVPNYLTDQYDIVKLVKDVHFHKDHPENHNVRIHPKIGTIYRKRMRDGKIESLTLPTNEILSELIQNGETIMSSYDKPLTNLQKNILDIISHTVETETNWNCLTEHLLISLQGYLDTLDFSCAKEKN
jgi:hypothetical protein